MNRLVAWPVWGLFLALAAAAPCAAQGAEDRGELAAPGPNTPDEPLRKECSPEAAARYLDAVATHWQRENKCFACHTGYAYLLARPAVGWDGAVHRQVRAAAQQAAEQDRSQAKEPGRSSESVMLAAALAINDAQTTRTLHPTTRRALDQMWTVQRGDGAWTWPIGCKWPPSEIDEFYGVVTAALAAGMAPGDYRQTPQAKQGLEKIRAFLGKNPPASAYQRGMLLWASQGVEGLLGEAQKKAAVEELLAMQRPDGGWSFAGLGKWQRSDGKPQDTQTSDGYGTGFAVYVLRLAGLPADHRQIQQGIAWLKTHQRESGRWHTRSANKDGKHYITNEGTALAILALAAVQAPTKGDCPNFRAQTGHGRAAMNGVGTKMGLSPSVAVKEIHVATSGNDTNPGTQAAPLRTIQRAAELAQPGDVITVHEGVYRERIDRLRGGESDQNRIVYQAAPGEKVEIKGSEVVKDWAKVQGDTWKATLPNSLFGNFNPYADLIRGDWFDARGRQHHTGAVYLNGQWLTEAARLDDVLKPAGNTPLWFGRVEKDSTTLWAQFKGVNPNEQLVEINVRRTVFYPEKPGMNYITLRGFRLCHAATPWAPPTAEQVGLVGTHWSKGWIIENNVVSHSVCSGIALGKYGDQWDNTSANTAEGYVKTIERALANGWHKENIGHHVVRNNTISHCEQAGVVGSLGAAFSLVENNVIHDIHVRQLFSGAEMAGIKFHAAIDTVIRHNHIHHTCRGLWLDWMAQGTRVSGNLFHDNGAEDLFVEVNHGPFLVDNNLMLSGTSLLDVSEGGFYVHNLIGGRIVSFPEPNRATPYHPPHTTAVAGLSKIRGGDDRFYNNLFVGRGGPPAVVAKPARKPAPRNDGYGLLMYDGRGCFPLQTGGNVYCRGARPSSAEAETAVVLSEFPAVKLVEEGNEVYLQLTLGQAVEKAKTVLATSQSLGKSQISGLAIENPDGTPVKIDADYFGKVRSATGPTPGPFEKPGAGPLRLKVW